MFVFEYINFIALCILCMDFTYKEGALFLLLENKTLSLFLNQISWPVDIFTGLIKGGRKTNITGQRRTIEYLLFVRLTIKKLQI